jgi:hypothetical protein
VRFPSGCSHEESTSSRSTATIEEPRRNCRESGFAARPWQPRNLLHISKRTPLVFAQPASQAAESILNSGAAGTLARRQPVACRSGREEWNGSWMRGRDGEASRPVGTPTRRLSQRRLRRQEGGCLSGATMHAAASAAARSPWSDAACISHALHRPHARTADSALPSDEPSPGNPGMTEQRHGNQRNDLSEKSGIERCVDLTARTRTTDLSQGAVGVIDPRCHPANARLLGTVQPNHSHLGFTRTRGVLLAHRARPRARTCSQGSSRSSELARTAARRFTRPGRPACIDSQDVPQTSSFVPPPQRRPSLVRGRLRATRIELNCRRPRHSLWSKGNPASMHPSVACPSLAT